MAWLGVALWLTRDCHRTPEEAAVTADAVIEALTNPAAAS
jgi:hypothetical protein